MKRKVLLLFATLILLYSCVHYFQTGIKFAFQRDPASGEFGASWPTFWAWKINPEIISQNKLVVQWMAPDETRPEYIPWAYGPVMHFLLFPLLYLDSFKVASHIWLILCHIFILASMFIWYKLLFLEKKLHSYWIFVAYVALWFNFFPLYEGLSSRVIENLELFLMSLSVYLYLKHKEKLSGFTLGLAIMTKFLPLCFVPYFLIKKKFKLCLITLLTIIGIGVAAQYTLKWKNNVTLGVLKTHATNPIKSTNYECQSVSCFVYRLLSTQPTPSVRESYHFGYVKDPQFARKVNLVVLSLIAIFYGIFFLFFSKNPVTFFEFGILFILMISWPFRTHPYYVMFAIIPASIFLYDLAKSYSQQTLKSLPVMLYIASFFMLSVFFPISKLEQLFDYLHFPPFLGFYQFYCLPVIGYLMILFWLTNRQFSLKTIQTN